MKKNIITSATAVIAFTLLLGVAYPLLMTGISQVAFHNRASGSPITVDGKVVGSRLLAQAYQLPVLDKNGKPKKDSDGNPVTQPDPKYFQPRPSQTGYNANGTFFSNRGPNQASAQFFYRDEHRRVHRPGGQVRPGPEGGRRPAGRRDDLRLRRRSPYLAGQRGHPVAPDRRRPQAPAWRRVQALIKDNTDGRSLGFLGEPGVNVTTLNLALDREAR